jgi:hypothetical protein
LADPGHHAAISLALVNIAIATHRPTLDSLVALKIIDRAQISIIDAFAASDRDLTEQTAKEKRQRRRPRRTNR